jgi:carotenoid cleavage dioxygenase-like enzyme
MSTAKPEFQFPQTAMNASRTELTDLPLHVVEGKIPADWSGHVFIIAPVGTVASDGLPNPEGTHLFNSDGMVYRFDLSPHQVTVKTKLARTPCYYADAATYGNPRYRGDGFQDHGMLRFSPTLGLRDEVDIAFLPFRAASETQDRLMITYDAGRPYEIDTDSLEIKAPVGANAEWKAFLPLAYPFPPVMSTSHPCFDAFTHEVFLVNYGRSLNNFLESTRFIYDAEQMPEVMSHLFHAIAELLETPLFRSTLEFLSQVSGQLGQWMMDWLDQLLGNAMPDFTYLVQWDGTGKLQHWKLMLPDGSPVRIEQSVHQLTVTEDYVVLIDTSLKIGPEQILNNPIPGSPGAERLLRKVLTRAQMPNSPVYIVRRADLTNPNQDPEPTVVVQSTVIPLETVHFATDYDNPNGQITLHAAHLCATDLGEWIHQFDVSKFKSPQPSSLALCGMLANGQMDVGRIGRYEIAAATGQVLTSEVSYDARRHWGVGFYTYREQLPNGEAPRKLDSIYWQSLGFWPDLLTEFVYDLYTDYPYRAISLPDLLNHDEAFHNRPSSMFRIDTATAAIADAYDAPPGYFMSSPQFVPRQQGSGSATDGYIVCTAFSATTKELWVFHGDRLQDGPICKLSHSDLNFGFTMHTAWLAAIAPRTSHYQVPIRPDYEPRLTQPALQQLFNDAVFPHFE